MSLIFIIPSHRKCLKTLVVSSGAYISPLFCKHVAFHSYVRTQPICGQRTLKEGRRRHCYVRQELLLVSIFERWCRRIQGHDGKGSVLASRDPPSMSMRRKLYKGYTVVYGLSLSEYISVEDLHRCHSVPWLAAIKAGGI